MKRETRLTIARRLRRELTPPEQVLWELLRERRLMGLKFRRQRPVGRYVADFCCDALALIVEVDGATHRAGDGPLLDSIRDRWLAEHGYRVLRLPAASVLADPTGALHAILAAAQALGDELDQPLASPSPAAREKGVGG